MAIRVFKCRSCGHRMRMANDVCHACFGSKRTYQLPQTFWIATLTALLFLTGLVLAVL